MLKGLKYRLYPTNEQSILINKHIGSCRFVYNLALETKLMAYAGNKVSLSCFDLEKQLPELKKECPWLKEINSQSLQQPIIHLDTAFKNFFKYHADFPNFKKKSGRQSFNVPQYIELDEKNSKLIIPKFKTGIDIVLHRTFKGTIKQVTISRTPTGKYFASILVDTNDKIPKRAPISEKTAIGIDLGLKSFLVTSDGQEINNPKYLRKAESRLRFTQRKYSLYKGKRTKTTLAILHEIVANQRKDFLHKLSSRLISENQTLCIEDLNIQGMSATCKSKQDEEKKYLPNGQSTKSGLNKSIIDAGWGMFITMLEYKAEWQGKNILKIGRFDPSSKTCSCCGSINKDLTLKDRVWTCSKCGAVLNRDINAAINIKNFALKNYLCVERTLKNQNDLPTLAGVLTSEAAIPLG